MTVKKFALLAMSCLLIAAGCSSTGAAHLTVSRPWARTSPMDATTGVVYFTVTSPTADTLTGVKVDPSVAAMAQMHETVMDNGAMKMQEVNSVGLPAGSAVEFTPGGYHVMLMQLAAPLKVGSTITLTLELKKAGAITVSVPVLEQAP